MQPRLSVATGLGADYIISYRCISTGATKQERERERNDTTTTTPHVSPCVHTSHGTDRCGSQLVCSQALDEATLGFQLDEVELQLRKVLLSAGEDAFNGRWQMAGTKGERAS